MSRNTHASVYRKSVWMDVKKEILGLVIDNVLNIWLSRVLVEMP